MKQEVRVSLSLHYAHVHPLFGGDHSYHFGVRIANYFIIVANTANTHDTPGTILSALWV